MKKVGWFCSYTPIEIISAAGLIPVGIKTDSKAEHEDVLLGDSICSYVRSCMGGALTGVYDDIDAVIIAHSCECMRRLGDGWVYRQKEITPQLIHVLDIPKVVSKSSINFFANAIKMMKSDIEKHFGKISDDDLKEAIKKYNKTRQLFSEIDEIRKNEDSPITGVEVEELILEFYETPVDEFNKKLSNFLESKKEASGERDRPRVMIIGGPGNKSLIKAIENSGGLSVIENMCTGLRSYCAQLNEEEDSYKQLAATYLSKTACPRMLGSKSKETIQEILELLTEYKVDGVLYYSMKFCANMQMQWAHLKNDVETVIPMKVIEGDISSEVNEREIHSFVKRLKKRRKRKK